jgi:hypothetical protein
LEQRNWFLMVGTARSPGSTDTSIEGLIAARAICVDPRHAKRAHIRKIHRRAVKAGRSVTFPQLTSKPKQGVSFQIT